MSVQYDSTVGCLRGWGRSEEEQRQERRRRFWWRGSERRATQFFRAQPLGIFEFIKNSWNQESKHLAWKKKMYMQMMEYTSLSCKKFSFSKWSGRMVIAYKIYCAQPWRWDEEFKWSKSSKRELEKNSLGLPRFCNWQINELLSRKFEMLFLPLVASVSYERHDRNNIYSILIVENYVKAFPSPNQVSVTSKWPFLVLTILLLLFLLETHKNSNTNDNDDNNDDYWIISKCQAQCCMVYRFHFI